MKVGGSLLAHIKHLDEVLNAIADVARVQRVLIVPGGGPFADAVRDVDARVGLTDDQAHWMAILGVDQSAHVVSGRLTNGVVVCSRQEIETAHQDRRVPVLAPSRWLRTADPLPHSWDVTSDSIAAWAAGELGAPRLLLVKAAGARGPHLVDRYFQQAIPSAVTHECLGAEDAVQWLDQLARDAAVERTPA